MFGFSGTNWGNLLGLHGVPGLMENNQLMMQSMSPQQQGYDGSATDLSSLLAQMRGGGGGMSSGASNPYIGGEGLI